MPFSSISRRRTSNFSTKITIQSALQSFVSTFKKAHALLLLPVTKFQRLLAHRRICINFARCFHVDSSTLKQKTNSTTSYAVTFVSSSAHRIRIYTDQLLTLLYSSALPHTIKEFPLTNFLHCFLVSSSTHNTGRIYTYQLLTLLHSSALPHTIM